VTIGLIAHRHNGEMLRVALWVVRTIGLAVVGLLTFRALPTVRGGAATQVIAYAVICVGVAAWGLAEFSGGTPAAMRRVGLQIALGAVTAAGCLGATAGGGGDSMVAFSAAALISAAEALSLQAWLACLLLGVLATEIGGTVFNEGLGTLLGFPLLLAVGVLLGRNRLALRVQTEQARQLLAQNEQLRAEQRRADVLEERARIAREVHDVLAHSLGALGIQLQTVRALFTVHHDPDRALEALATAQRMASVGLTETRRAVLALRTDLLPLHDELAHAAAELAERHHIHVDCQTSGTPLLLPPEATLALLRIARESLINAVKHAPGAEIAVDLSYREDGVRLTVTNPLTGAGPGAADNGSGGSGAGGSGTDGLRTLDAGYGLTGMRERLLLLRGSLEAGRRDGDWVVTAELPLPAGPLTPAPLAGAPGTASPPTASPPTASSSATGSFTTAPVAQEADL
jgi:signal transduction histidine kinase